MIPPLLPDNHPLLATKMPRHVFDDMTTDIAATLVESMTYYHGIGLAANQIGITTSAFAMEFQGGALVLFNPMVTWLSSDMSMLEEGCLSFPELDLRVRRPKEVQLRYEDQNQKVHVLNLTGIECRCALHELDHLDGVVFTSKVSRLKLMMARKKQRKKA